MADYVETARCNCNFYFDRFFSRTIQIWNSFFPFCFSVKYDLKIFKCSVNCHVLSFECTFLLLFSLQTISHLFIYFLLSVTSTILVFYRLPWGEMILKYNTGSSARFCVFLTRVSTGATQQLLFCWPLISSADVVVFDHTAVKMEFLSGFKTWIVLAEPCYEKRKDKNASAGENNKEDCCVNFQCTYIIVDTKELTLSFYSLLWHFASCF